MMYNRTFRDIIMGEFAAVGIGGLGGNLGEPGYDGRFVDQSQPPGWANPAAYDPYYNTLGGDPFFSDLFAAARQTQEPWWRPPDRPIQIITEGGVILDGIGTADPILVRAPDRVAQAKPFDPQAGNGFAKWLLYGKDIFGEGYSKDTSWRDAATNDKNLQTAQNLATGITLAAVTLATGGIAAEAAVALGATTVEAGLVGGATGGMASAYYGAGIQGRLPTTQQVFAETTVGGVFGTGASAIESKVIPAIIARSYGLVGAGSVGAGRLGQTSALRSEISGSLSVAEESSLPTPVAQTLYGPYTHMINHGEGAVSSIVRQSAMIRTEGRYGDIAVRAQASELVPLGAENFGKPTIEFFTHVPPSNSNAGNGYVWFAGEDGTLLDIVPSRIAHADGSITIFIK